MDNDRKEPTTGKATPFLNPVHVKKTIDGFINDLHKKLYDAADAHIEMEVSCEPYAWMNDYVPNSFFVNKIPVGEVLTIKIKGNVTH